MGFSGGDLGILIEGLGLLDWDLGVGATGLFNYPQFLSSARGNSSDYANFVLRFHFLYDALVARGQPLEIANNYDFRIRPGSGKVGVVLAHWKMMSYANY